MNTVTVTCRNRADFSAIAAILADVATGASVRGISKRNGTHQITANVDAANVPLLAARIETTGIATLEY